jgi:hypothetical protein
MKVAESTVQIIGHYLNNDVPVLNSQDRRIINIFMVLYGPFAWTGLPRKEDWHANVGHNI